VYILLALIAACALGIAVHYLLPRRTLRGVALVPAVSTAAAAIIYTVMQWSGVGAESIWLWLTSILGAVVISAVAGYVLTTARVRSDAETKAALGI